MSSPENIWGQGVNCEARGVRSLGLACHCEAWTLSTVKQETIERF